MNRILVIQHKMIGDVLISSIICNNLKKAYPNAQIDYLVNDNTVDVLKGNPNIDSLIIFEKKHQNSTYELIKFALGLRKNKYDLVIDAYSKLQSWIIVLLCRGKRKISYKKIGRTFLYEDNIPYAENPSTNLGLAIERRLSLLTPLNLNFELDGQPKLFLDQLEKDFADKIFENHKVDKSKKTVMISLLGSEKLKTYPLQYMTEIIDFISDKYNVNILFNYFPKQLEEAKIVFNSCKKSTQQNIYFDLLGSNLREYIAIMNKCDLIIGNDGGAINLAKAVNKPSFIIFSPWIEKKIWATFEDGKKHMSIHLNDISSDLISNKTEKQLKENTLQLYEKLEPKFVIEKISPFLDNYLL
ncbi:MAG: glycosyltransferase family 9 protein [Flavobacterium sp.]|jgi:ADP-heptose:LPS heptosyltransferase|uniref:glycosyltransferase family 9 protein n=1 Tax=Flavobacterium sp. TaxID=239 RepID=UPI003782D937